MLLILVLGVFSLGLAVYFAVEAATAPARDQEAAVRRATRYGLARVRGGTVERLRFSERVLAPAVRRLASLTLRLNPKTSIESIASRLHAAGLAGRIAPIQFLALKGALGVGGLFGMVALSVATKPIAGILLAPLTGVFGFLFPDVFLTFRIRSRRDSIRAQLPDALDLLAVSVEAGLGLDGALTKLTEHMEGPLVEEFALTLGEIRIGESRQEALKHLTERVQTPELAAFVRSVIQAEQLGISLGRILRVQGADSRLRRQAAAEEKGMKAPIKMLFPTVVFIFPAMFLVILGPAFLHLSEFLR